MRRAERGQALIIVALLSAILVGLVGLSIDGGEVAGEQELVQASADGAALAGAYDAGAGTTQAVATTLASLVVQGNGVTASSLTMAYQDSSGATVAGPGTAGVVRVQATVAETRATFFLGALGVPNFRLVATARATIRAGNAPCTICVLPGSGVTYHQQQNSAVTVTGAPVVINSTSSGNLTVDKKATLSAPSILLGALVAKISALATVTPSPTVGTVSDRLVGLAYPVVGGNLPDVSNSSGTNTLPPGVYKNVAVTGGTLTLAGSYVITGALTVSAGTLNSTGSLVFLACPGYPTPCPAATAGGSIGATGGTLSLAAQSSGTYAGLAVFGDRNNTAPSSFTSTAVALVGTYYTAGAGVTFNNTSTTQNLQSEVIVAALDVASSTSVSVSYSSAQNATFGSSSLALAP